MHEQKHLPKPIDVQSKATISSEHLDINSEPGTDLLRTGVSHTTFTPLHQASDLLQLQRSVGNRTVGQLLHSHHPRSIVTNAVQRGGPEESAQTTPAPGVLNPAEQAFLNQTVEAASRVALAAGKFSAWLSAVTIPYAEAWNDHRTTLQSASQSAKDANALVLGVILASIPGGVGGMVGRTMQGLGMGVALVDGIKDLAKYGLRSAASTAISDLSRSRPSSLSWAGDVEPAPDSGATSPGSPRSSPAPAGQTRSGGADPDDITSVLESPRSCQPPPVGADPANITSIAGAPRSGAAFERMPPNPLVWQNATNRRTEEEVLNPAREIVLSWQHRVNNHDATFDYAFDPVDAVNNSLKLNNVSLFNLADPPGDLKLAFERGFLRDWIDSEAFRVFASHSQFAWGKIADKLEAYGIRIGFTDVRAYMGRVVNLGVRANNRRARSLASGLMLPPL